MRITDDEVVRHVITPGRVPLTDDIADVLTDLIVRILESASGGHILTSAGAETE